MTGELYHDSVIKAMAKKIKTEYPLLPIYVERAVQNMKLPAFFIGSINTSTVKKMNNRYKMNWQMEVRYHTSVKNPAPYEELNSIGKTLTFLLDRIALVNFEDGIERGKRGRNIAYKIADGILLFYVDYEIDVIRYIPPDPLMGSLEIIENVKEE